MKSYSNTYIFVFSTVMVIIVAILLSFVAEKLRPLQEKNVAIEKKLDILRSVGIARDLEGVKDKDSYVQENYEKYITKEFVITPDGQLQEGLDAFTINLKVELAKAKEERNLPVFVYTDAAGVEKYIIPMLGKGLWGPIWGYVSFNDDFETIYGAIFAHAKETPGLGAEINQEWFQVQYTGKRIFDENGKFVSVTVVKGGTADDNPYGVDAISGGTITSKALQEMMFQCLQNYEFFLKSKIQ